MQAAADLKAEGITLAKMDATEEKNKAITPKYGVKGFPTIKVFRNHNSDKHEVTTRGRVVWGLPENRALTTLGMCKSHLSLSALRSYGGSSNV